MATALNVGPANFSDMHKRELVRVFVKGGIISPGDLLKIINTAEELGSDYVHFGSRQDILFPVAEKKRQKLDVTFKSIQTMYDCDGEEFQNIVSSYVALDVMPSTSWLAHHLYHYILDTFDYQPKIKINLTDPAQTMVPLFTGHLNFVASEKENYWYLYVRDVEQANKLWKCPKLIYSYDLVKVAQYIEAHDLLGGDTNWDDTWLNLTSAVSLNTVEIDHEINLPKDPFPYYEGMNRVPDGKYWLGLYWRNNKFSIPFLRALSKLCQDTHVGKLSLTPWKSFITKGIDEKYLIIWEKLLGKYGINVRHSSLELNWHLPMLDEQAISLKNYLVRALDKQDISTYGMTFTIKSKPIILFTSVVIERNNTDGAWEKDTYNLLYAKAFNPNNAEYLYYAKNVKKEILPPLLIEISHLFYEQLDISTATSHNTVEKLEDSSMYQCVNCLTVYDESIGDPENGIKEGTSFSQLPKDYTCPLCGSPKSTFVEMMGIERT